METLGTHSHTVKPLPCHLRGVSGGKAPRLARKPASCVDGGLRGDMLRQAGALDQNPVPDTATAAGQGPQAGRCRRDFSDPRGGEKG